MKRLVYILFLTSAAVCMFFSCAKDKNETEEETSKRILNSWLLVNGYGDVTPTYSGNYILSDEEGSGDMLVDSIFVMVNYYTASMSGTYSAYTQEDLAIQMGTWSKTGRYTPKIWYLPYQGVGVRDILIGQGTGTDRTGGMRTGGARCAVVVPWAKNPSTGKPVSHSDYTPLIYDIEVVDYTTDIYDYQIRHVEQFIEENNWTERDSVYYGLYMENTLTDPEKDTIADGTSISLWYVGKYLDGQVFDTNIKDTARFYDIYDESRSYSSSSITFYQDSSSIMENSSYVKGFTLAVNRMRRYGDRCHTAFISTWGYGEEGNGDIPGYTPLFFEIWVEDND